jgi:hypothetical protein
VKDNAIGTASSFPQSAAPMLDWQIIVLILVPAILALWIARNYFDSKKSSL